MDRKSSFTVLLTTALCALASNQHKVYHYVPDAKVWSEAQEYCRRNYADLAFFSTKKELDQVKSSSLGLTWIGLYYKDPTGWTWSGLENNTTKNTFWNWMTGEPNNAFGVENCAAVELDLWWLDFLCSVRLPFICYQQKSELILVQQMKSWEEALYYCREHYTDLASLPSETKQFQAQNEMVGAETDQVWTGLTFLASEWLWVDGKPLEYQAWTGGQQPVCPPRHLHCGTMARDEENWGIRNCEERRNFLCDWV